MAKNARDRVALINYAAEVASKAVTKQQFFDTVISRFRSASSNEQQRQELFDALGLQRGVKLDEFRAALDKMHAKFKCERESRRRRYKIALAEYNVRAVFRQASSLSS